MAEVSKQPLRGPARAVAIAVMSLVCAVLTGVLLRHPSAPSRSREEPPPPPSLTDDQRRSMYRGWPMFNGWPLPQLPRGSAPPASEEPETSSPPEAEDRAH